MKKQTLVTKLHKPVHPVLSLVLILVGLVGIGSIIMLALQSSRKPTSPQQQHTIQSTSSVLPKPTVEQAPAVTFTSPDLGISFDYTSVYHYPRSDKGQYFFTREIGSKVFLYSPTGDQPFSGTDAEFLNKIGGVSVEVFRKDPTLSLQDAIKQRFLSGYTGTDCFVKPTRYGFPREDMSYQAASIDYRPIPNQTLSDIHELINKCPSPDYVTAFGVSYFMMDPKHPNKLLYINIGQSNASGANGFTWDETLKVLQ